MNEGPRLLLRIFIEMSLITTIIIRVVIFVLPEILTTTYGWVTFVSTIIFTSLATTCNHHMCLSWIE